VIADVTGDGFYTFTGLSAGNYVVETVAPNGTIVGTSATMTVTVGATTEVPNTVVSLRAAAVRRQP
jgi:hypothetical protein